MSAGDIHVDSASRHSRHLKETSVKIMTFDNNDIFSQQSIGEQGCTPPSGLLKRGEVGGFSDWTTEEPSNRKKRKKRQR